MWITAECVDGDYADPVIDSEDDIAEPVEHRRISGHFAGTDIRFTFYLPPKDHWQGRFFHSVYPLDDEHASARAIEFAAASGGYVVQTNSSGGYRADAAAAKYSRTVAQRYYDTADRIFGYIWGGSGGSFQTIAAMENSTGVWDGGVPFIVGDPSSIPNNFFSRAKARLVLGDKAAQIGDAVAPGSYADPYVGLDDAQRQVLREITDLGMPLRAWEDGAYVLGLQAPDGLLGFATQMKEVDPTYLDDFWSQPGYLGTEKSALGDRIRAARINHQSTITNIERGPHGTRVTLDAVPATDYDGMVDFTVGHEDRERAPATAKLDDSGVLTLADEQSGAPLQIGAEVSIDNHWYLALLDYTRHQVPQRAGFDAYDQYRWPDGSPRYPQRPLHAGSLISESVSGGGTHTGNIHGKVIAVSNLLDADAFPWHGDWYRRQVQQALGARFDDNFRLWFNDNADHQAEGRTPRLIDYTGILERALRDVAAWAETGRPPAASTRYSVSGSQIEVPAAAAERRGVQPVVELTADGEGRAEVVTGQPVRLQAIVDIPPGAGKVSEVAWNPTGDGGFVTDTALARTVSFDRPGIYFPAVRVTLRRDDDGPAPFADVLALGRVRVVVLP